MDKPREITRLKSALTAWTDLLGAENVVTDRIGRNSAQSATFGTTHTIPGIIRPADRAQIQDSLRIANRYQVAVYPISQGKNWGYGSRVPPADECVLMDVSRLNRILDYDEDLAYVRVEPGVTFQQLFDFLRQQNSRLIVNTIGSTPHASLIGNMVERGIGTSPYAESAAHVCGLQIVLPTGECIHTGFQGFSNAKTGALHRWGVGPHLDGLFMQSNLGIVTEATFWLATAPEWSQRFVVQLDNTAGLSTFIEALRSFHKNANLNVRFGLWNDYRVLASIEQYPWELTRGNVPLPDDLLDESAKRYKFKTWNGFGTIYAASQNQASAAKELTENWLGSQANYMFFEELTVHTNLNSQHFPFGTPSTKSVRSAYWRKKIQSPPGRVDLDRDACGVIWCDIITPLRGKDVANVLEIIAQTFLADKFESCITIPYMPTRCAYIAAAIIYDRLTPEEDSQAAQCYMETMQALMQQGYTAPRLNILSMQLMDRAESGYIELLQALKKTFDPNNILAPQRYIRL